MNYLSVCSGIEAATVAWRPLGWEAVGFSEIEKFPNAVLAHHYPDTPNFGDMNDFRKWPKANIDVLVGGTPCQSFSVAGLRQGMADPRGNLALVYLAIAERYRPDWLVWENVPAADSGTNRTPALMHGMAVRRLTPLECTRLQGFPDDYFDGVPGRSDSAVYKALGNAMAIPVMAWIGKRIAAIS